MSTIAEQVADFATVSTNPEGTHLVTADNGNGFVAWDFDGDGFTFTTWIDNEPVSTDGDTTCDTLVETIVAAARAL